MFRDGDTNDAPAIMREQHQDEQESARGRRDSTRRRSAAINCCAWLAAKNVTGLRGPRPAPDDVCGHGCLRNGES